MVEFKGTTSDAVRHDRMPAMSAPLPGPEGGDSADQHHGSTRVAAERPGPVRRLRWRKMLVGARMPHGGRLVRQGLSSGADGNTVGGRL